MLTTKVGLLESALNGATKKIDLLEAFNRADNLVIVGKPATNFSDAVSTHTTDSTSTSELNIATEQTPTPLTRHQHLS